MTNPTARTVTEIIAMLDRLAQPDRERALGIVNAYYASSPVAMKPVPLPPKITINDPPRPPGSRGRGNPPHGNPQLAHFKRRGG